MKKCNYAAAWSKKILEYEIFAFLKNGQVNLWDRGKIHKYYVCGMTLQKTFPITKRLRRARFKTYNTNELHVQIPPIYSAFQRKINFLRTALCVYVKGRVIIHGLRTRSHQLNVGPSRWPWCEIRI